MHRMDYHSDHFFLASLNYMYCCDVEYEDMYAEKSIMWSSDRCQIVCALFPTSLHDAWEPPSGFWPIIRPISPPPPVSCSSSYIIQGNSDFQIELVISLRKQYQAGHWDRVIEICDRLAGEINEQGLFQLGSKFCLEISL